MPRHLAYIDWLKCLAIMMVVMYHCAWFNNTLTASLFSICCPLFFIINGGLSLQKDYDFATILRRTVHLLIIALFWGCLSTVIYMCHQSEPLTIKIIVSHICSLDAPYCNHLWFVCSLIVLTLFQPFLREFVKTHQTKEVFLLWVIVGLISLQGINNFLRPISIMSNWNGYSLFYYIGGYLLTSNRLGLKCLPTWSILSFIALGSLLLVLHNWLLTTNDWWFNHFLHNDMFFDSYSTIPCAILSFAVFEFFSRIPLKDSRIASYIAKYTFAIYLIHWTLLIPANNLMGTSIVKPFVLILVSLLIGLAIDFIPYLNRIIRYK